MKSNIIAASIVSIGLIVAGYLYGGRYYFIRLDKCTVARADRLTGKIQQVSDFECAVGFSPRPNSN